MNNVIFGAGCLLTSFATMFSIRNEIDFIVDNDEALHGKIFEGVEIKHPKLLQDMDKEKTFVYISVLPSSNAYMQIAEQLNSYGLIENKHFSKLSAKDFKKNSCTIDYGNLNIPNLVRRYEQFYDHATGGYYGLDNKPNYANVEVEVGRFYYSFINMVGKNMASILETGTNTGYSTCMLAAALKSKNPEGIVYTIDVESLFHFFDGDKSLSENIIFIEGYSTEVQLPDNIEFDILVIDSDHKYGTVMSELIRFEPMLKDGGYILMHDSIFYDGVGLCVEQLYSNPRFEVITFETPRETNNRGVGVTVVRKNNSIGHMLTYNAAYSDNEVYSHLSNTKRRSIVEKMRNKESQV